jgi:putative ABC transport system permease protein
MSLLSRITNAFRGEGLSREIDEELQSHVAEAIEQGRDPIEAKKALGSALRRGEESRDIRIAAWLDSLRADAVFGWRQLMKHKVTSGAAILSLALAIGSCTSAFRLIDALLLRPLPVAEPDRLYALAYQFNDRDGKTVTGDMCEYPLFRQMRALVKDQAELIAISGAWSIDLTYGSEDATEKAYQQYVSGWMFQSFGLRPALGRLLTENDDLTPGAHPYAVLSYDYWTRRFGQDPKVIGRTFRADGDVYQIVGVAPAPFTGTEPGKVTDLFVPTMMIKQGAIFRSDYRWFRTYVKLKAGVALAPVRDKLRPAFRAFLEERAKAFKGMPQRDVDGYLAQTLVLNPAGSGVSGTQRGYGRPLAVLGALVALVLLISCANVANLMTARAAARAREIALRVSIGAGRGRLVQLVLVECAWIAFLAAAVGSLFAAWSAPFVVGMINLPDNPVRLVLPADGRVLGFGLAMALGVTMLFGLAPALRASAVKPVSALKGGDDPHARRRLMHALIAAQVAFCFLVLFVAGLFVATFDRLAHQPTGFSADRLLTVETVTARPQPAALWDQVADQLRAVPGVETVAISEWPLMTGASWNGFISVNGGPPGEIDCYFLTVSSAWRDVMRIPLVEGRDFRPGDTMPGTAIVNRKFARQYFGADQVVGKSFDVVSNEGPRTRYQIVGLVGDVRYKDMREPVQPSAYFPFRATYTHASFIVRTAGADPLALASVLRREVPRARPGFHVSTIRTQLELVQQHTIIERLLARLALFFAAVALLLAAIGLYGVLDYSVLQRRREIGIRIAIGAQSSDIARRVTADVLAMVVAGAVSGIVLGMISARYIGSLLYEVKPGDLGMVAFPTLAILGVTVLAALPAIVRAVGMDPVASLRSE